MKTKLKAAPSAHIEITYPFPFERFAEVWEWMQPFFASVADDFSPVTAEQFLAIEESRKDQVVTFAIWRDGELGGCVWAYPVSPILVDCHCVFKKSFFGHRTTLPALEQVKELLFNEGVEKIQMQVFAHNNAVRSLIRKLGGVEEGRLRAHTRQQGSPIDVIVYGLFKFPQGSNPVEIPPFLPQVSSEQFVITEPYEAAA